MISFRIQCHSRIASKRPEHCRGTVAQETDLADRLTNIRNRHVQVDDAGGSITFLHTVAEGATGRSFGVHVGCMADLPKAVHERAAEILGQLEESGAAVPDSLADLIQAPTPDQAVQSTLFLEEHPAMCAWAGMIRSRNRICSASHCCPTAGPKPTADGLPDPMAADIIRSGPPGPHPTRIDMSTTPLGPAATATDLLEPFPDPPPRHPDEMSSHRHLSERGAPYLLNWHFGNPDTTLITAELYIAPEAQSGIKGLRAPDLMIAFNVDPEAYHRSNAYIITEQGKPPDFVLEVASRSTGRIDVRDKPADYAALGIPEYWRFDETGEHHGVRLAGDRLVGDRYEPIEITELPDGSLEGYSEVLDLYLRWEDGWLQWHDPETGRAIMNLAEMQRIAEEERQGRLEERQARLEEQKARLEERQARLEEQKARLEAEQRAEEAEQREETERQARLDAEHIAAERIRELEAKQHRRGH